MADEQKFMLVLFVDDIGKTRSIDIVPANWIIYDDTVDHLVTPFISDCSKANLRILSDLVKSRGEPLLSWSKHRISIKGAAKTYAEAERKLKDLETHDHVFTTDNETHAAVRENNIIKKYKLKGNKFESHDVAAMLKASAFEVTPQKGKNVLRNKKVVSTKKKQFVSPKKKPIFSPKKKHFASKNKTQQKTEKIQKVESDSEKSGSVYSEESFTERSSDDDINELIEHRQEVTAAVTVQLKPNARDMRENKIKKEGPSDSIDFEIPIVSDTESNHTDSSFMRKPAIRKEVTDMSGEKITTSSHNIFNVIPSIGSSDLSDTDDLKAIILGCYRRLSTQIGQVQSAIADLSLRQTEIACGINTNTLKNITGIDTTVEKYSLGELPLKTMADFEKFDNKLKEDKSIQKEIINGMSALVSSDLKYLIRSARNIFQRFMSRDLILMFTAVRQSGKKKVLKDETAFYICIRDAILTECNKKPGHSPVKEKQIQEAIGSVINNAKDWEGHRQIRAKK